MYDYILTAFRHTVKSLMFAGIKLCVLETRPCSQGLMFEVSSGLVSYLGTHEIFLWVFIFTI